MPASLPPNPNLDNLKKQARGLLKAYRAGDSRAVSRVRVHHQRFAGETDADTGGRAFTLRDAQHVLAREHGFTGWEQLSFVVGLKRRIFTMAKSSPTREAPRVTFSDRVRQAMQSARMEAGALNHDYIGTEHVLLGVLLQPEGAAYTVLRDLGLEPEALVDRVRHEASRASPAAKPADGQVFRPRAKDILETAAAEAEGLGVRTVGTGHVLLALTRDAETASAGIMGEQNVDYEGIRCLLGSGSDG